MEEVNLRLGPLYMGYPNKTGGYIPDLRMQEFGLGLKNAHKACNGHAILGRLRTSCKTVDIAQFNYHNVCITSMSQLTLFQSKEVPSNHTVGEYLSTSKHQIRDCQVERLVACFAAQGLGKLSAAEARVLEQLLLGHCNKRISALIGKAVPTVKLHISRMCKRYAVRNRTALCVLATQTLLSVEQ
jgi:DNA-binding CsgD family transcriptional regulator